MDSYWRRANRSRRKRVPGAPQHVIHGAPLGVRCRAKGLAGSAGCLFPGLPARAGVWRAGGVGRQGSRRSAGAGSDIGADLPTTLARQYATANKFLWRHATAGNRSARFARRRPRLAAPLGAQATGGAATSSHAPKRAPVPRGRQG